MGSLRRTFMIAAIAAVAPSARAGVLLRADFESTATSANPYFYTYGGGTATGTTITSGGNPNSAYQVVTDFTSATNPGFPGMGAGFQIFTPGLVTPPASSAEFTVSFDLNITGTLPGVTATPIQFQFYLKNTTPATTYLDLEHTVNYDVAAGGFQHLSVTFSDADLSNGTTIANTAANTANINQIQVNVNIPNGASDFGFDPNNTATFDNVQVTQTPVPTPEPASLSLVALACGGALFLRRRRNA